MTDRNQKRRKIVIDAPYRICATCKKVESEPVHRCQKKCDTFRKRVDDQLCCRRKKNECECLDESEKKELCQKIMSKHKFEDTGHSNITPCNSKNNDVNTTIYTNTHQLAKPKRSRVIESRINEIQKLNNSVCKKWTKLKMFSIPEGDKNNHLKDMYEEFEERYGYAKLLLLDAKTENSGDAMNDLKTAKMYLVHNMEQLDMIETEQDIVAKRNKMVKGKCCWVNRLIRSLFGTVCFPFNRTST